MANKNVLQKRIPTLLGVGVLVLGLVVGTILFRSGTGVFSPRASAEAMPTSVRTTNLTDSTFTVSFLTGKETQGFIQYGTSATNLDSQVSDDRVQLSAGNEQLYTLHHITVRGLQPETTYYYVLGADGNEYDKEGKPFQITTTKRGSVPPAARTINGTILSQDNQPAADSVVYVSLTNVGEMSTLVRNPAGSWAIPLSDARKKDGSGYAEIKDTDLLNIFVQGTNPSDTIQYSTAVSGAQPVTTLAFGTPPQEQTTAYQPPATESKVASESTQQKETSPSPSTIVLVPSSTPSPLPSPSPSPSPSSTTSTLGRETNKNTIDLTQEAHTTVETTQPTISGTAAPQVKVVVTINSETQIIKEVVTDDSGNFLVDLEQLGEQLEPGEHTVQYQYTDPNTGQPISKTQTFTVTGGSSRQLAQVLPSPSATPYGTGNPYPITSPSPSPSPSLSPSPTASMSASPSATVSGRVAYPSTESGIPVSGSVDTTLMLIISGIFLLFAGTWTFWVGNELHSEE
ncbi:MAG: fibronectin type III domain-containing protein [Pseudomonadales bacterium]|nr:fibronectin type III domain-containing protein [Candidatus Woesebacteria bacterium]MCB9801779.1 fibronectin type III domain-containing protein [Pseudomonadales bacterium]